MQAWWELVKAVAKTVAARGRRVARPSTHAMHHAHQRQRRRRCSASPSFTAETALTILRNVVDRPASSIAGADYVVPEAAHQRSSCG